MIRSATAFSSKSREDIDKGAEPRVVRKVEGREGRRKAWARGRRERTREEEDASFMAD